MSNVREFGARGDGTHDDTAALSHAVQRSDGRLSFPRGDYLISRPLHIPLQLHGRISLDGEGGTARIIMNGPGPALHLVGTHRRSAHPDQFTDAVWLKERMPSIRALEIVGQHAEADGIRIDGVMQPTLQGVLIRRCRHGIHLANRDRNVLIADCHIYHNTGTGIFFDHVNLHQTNIHGSHISYCKQGGIKIVGSEIRNLQKGRFARGRWWAIPFKHRSVPAAPTSASWGPRTIRTPSACSRSPATSSAASLPPSTFIPAAAW
jgi:hypothetical protein